MKTALIGHSGFVGSNLAAQRSYGDCFRSTNIEEIAGRSYDHIVCAGVQAMKWWANLHPEEDWQGIERLLTPLSQASASRFTLLSTIDVYPSPRGVDETSEIDVAGHHAYGLHRLRVEAWIREHFPEVLIVRLPGLFGPGLKKNVIYDLIHDNDLHKVHPDGCFQYYDMRRLANDIDRAWELGLSLLNVSSEPLKTSEIRDRFFPGKELGGSGPAPAGYDMRSLHAGAWEGADGYLYSRAQIVDDLGSWLSSPNT